MERVTFIESIIKILNLIASVPFFIEILLLSFILLIAMIFFYFRKSKKGKITSLIIYIVTLFLLPISHFSFFAETLDRIIENYMEILYFPSCYIYIALLIITDISVFRNVVKNVNDEERKWYKSFDLLYFFLFQFLFFVIVRTVIAEKIDIFERAQLYSNASLTSLLQISSYLFWIRMGIKLLAFIINRISKSSVPNLSENKEDSFNKKIESVVEKNDNIHNEDTSIRDNNFEVNNFYIEETTDKNDNLSKQLSSFQDFSVNIDNKTNEKSSFNNKQNSIRPLDDFVLGNTNLKKENLEDITQNIKSGSSTETTIENNVNLELTEEENEDFFDDFYE